MTCREGRLRRLRKSRVEKARGPPSPVKVISKAAPVSEHRVTWAPVTVVSPGRREASRVAVNETDQRALGLPTSGRMPQ